MSDRRVTGWELVIAVITFTALGYYALSTILVVEEGVNVFTTYKISAIILATIAQIYVSIAIANRLEFSGDINPDAALYIGWIGSIIPLFAAEAVALILQGAMVLAVITVAVLLFAVVVFCDLLRRWDDG